MGIAIEAGLSLWLSAPSTLYHNCEAGYPPISHKRRVGTSMDHTIRAISTAWIAAVITFVLTVAIALLTAYVKLHGDTNPSWFDTLTWVFILVDP
jgi:hypothetical protein